MQALALAIVFLMLACASKEGSVIWWINTVLFLVTVVYGGIYRRSKDKDKEEEEAKRTEPVEHEPLDVVNRDY